MKTVIAAVLLLAAGAASASAGTLTLREALELAAKQNPALRTASYDQQIAAENVAIARSGYLPRVDAHAGYTLLKDPQGVIFNGKSMPTQDRNFGTAGISLNQSIYDFGRRKSLVEQAELGRKAIAANYAGETQEVFLSVVGSYYGVIRAEKFRDAAQDEVKQRENHLKVARARYEEGVTTRNDVLQAEVRLANSRQTLLARQNDLDNAWLFLNYSIGQQPSFRASLKEQPGEVTPLKDEDFMVRIDEKRQEVAALKRLAEAADAAVRTAKTGYYPEVVGNLGVDYVENSRVKEQAMMSAGVGIRMNLYEGGAGAARIRQAVLERSKAEERLRELQQRLYLEYRSAWNDMLVARDRIAVTVEAITQSEENLRINTERYREGVGTATDVLDAQTLLTATKTEHDRAVTDYYVAVARVRKALGEI